MPSTSAGAMNASRMPDADRNASWALQPRVVAQRDVPDRVQPTAGLTAHVGREPVPRGHVREQAGQVVAEDALPQQPVVREAHGCVEPGVVEVREPRLDVAVLPDHRVVVELGREALAAPLPVRAHLVDVTGQVWLGQADLPVAVHEPRVAELVVFEPQRTVPVGRIGVGRPGVGRLEEVHVAVDAGHADTVAQPDTRVNHRQPRNQPRGS